MMQPRDNTKTKPQGGVLHQHASYFLFETENHIILILSTM